jgi:4,4'-diaponeurosporenoate glycosyltransferase
VSWVDLLVYLAATVPAWVVMKQIPTLPPPKGSREPVSVIVPARNEAHQIGDAVSSIRAQLGSHDELIVVDDDSSDETVNVARGLGARVIEAGKLPQGWRGKPHACFVGASAATKDILVFLDADVRMQPGALSKLCGVLGTNRDALVSVQPLHLPVRVGEHAAMSFNVVSILASGAGVRREKAMAFGPVIACTAERYHHVGGHGSLDVRNQVNEDVALGRSFLATKVFLGSFDTFVFRMYPQGFRSLIRGFTKNIAAGASSARGISLLVAVAWVSAQVGAVFTSPILYGVAVIQVWWLARRVGRFGIVGALLYPLHLGIFIAVLMRSALVRLGLGSIRWAGRVVR